MTGRALALAVVIVAGLASAAAADLFRWIDGDGTLHYTADLAAIPPAYREAAVAVNHPAARPAVPPGPTVTVVPVPGGAPMIVDARLNGLPLRLMLDTGADRTVISPDAISRAGLDATGGRRVRITGVTGSAEAALVQVERLDVAGARLGPIPVVVHAISMQGVDGLLGRDVLEAFTVTVDAASGQATIQPR